MIMKFNLRGLHVYLSVLGLCAIHCFNDRGGGGEGRSNVGILVNANLLIAGSANLDTFLRLKRLPQPGENLALLPNTQPIIDIPGGKGCNQAIACQKLSCELSETDTGASTSTTAFLGRIGRNDGGSILKDVLTEHDVSVDHLEECDKYPTGRGYVFLEHDTGRVSAVVSGGSNMYGWEVDQNDKLQSGLYLNNLFSGTKCLLLQCEIPESVNLILARHATKENIIVIHDIGGEDRPMDDEMMSCCDYIMPNLTELKRLVKSITNDDQNIECGSCDRDGIITLAKVLQSHGAKNVLVTLAEEGSILIQENGGILYQEPYSLESLNMGVVDETGAGDCFRAGFTVALTEEMKSLQDCMKFASAAGALACTKEGAVPSIPSRAEVDSFMKRAELTSTSFSSVNSLPRGGSISDDNVKDFPYMFGSRLNSMKDRPELWNKPVDNVREWVKRQGTIKGLGCVDFNYPQHFHEWDAKDAKKALEEVGLVAGAVCLRYPSKFARGAMNHPDEELRREAVEMTKKAALVARELGCNEVVIWSACEYDNFGIFV